MLRFPNTIARRACSKTHRTQGRQLCASSRETNNSAQRSNKHNSYAIRAMASRRRRAACRNECAGRWKCVIAKYTTVTRRITHVLLRQLCGMTAYPVYDINQGNICGYSRTRKIKHAKNPPRIRNERTTLARHFVPFADLATSAYLAKDILMNILRKGSLKLRYTAKCR
jgi:hypothetical protein